MCLCLSRLIALSRFASMSSLYLAWNVNKHQSSRFIIQGNSNKTWWILWSLISRPVCAADEIKLARIFLRKTKCFCLCINLISKAAMLLNIWCDRTLSSSAWQASRYRKIDQARIICFSWTSCRLLTQHEPRLSQEKNETLKFRLATKTSPPSLRNMLNMSASE